MIGIEESSETTSPVVATLPAGLQATFRATAGKLIESMRLVVQGLAERPTRAVEIERSLGIGRNIAHRFARSLAEPDIVEAIHVGPGPAPLRQILRAAERRGATRAAVDQARSALRDFEALIELHAGDRSTLDVIMGGWLSPVRERIDLLARQSIHRGFSHIRGCSTKLQFVITFIHPSTTNPLAADGVTCELFRGLVRLRGGARVRVGSFNELAPDGISPTLTIDGMPARSAKELLLDSWSSLSADVFRFETAGSATSIELADQQLGLSMPANLAVAMRYASCVTLTRPAESSPGIGPVADIQLPAEQLVFDVHVHPSLFVGQTPRLVVRDTAVERTLTKDKRNEAIFEADSHFVPLDRARAGHKLMPDYAALFDSVAKRTGWPIETFRSYRATMRFPIYGSLVHAYFDRPAREST